MKLVLQGLQWKICLIYLDDVVVLGSSVEEHMERVSQVFECIRQAKLKLKPEKCQLLQKEVTFLGHVINELGISPNPENVEKLVQMKVPRNVREVRGFLGLDNYYRKFIAGYSQIAKSLVDLTRKNAKFDWTEECEQSFNQLKRALTGADIMAYPKDHGRFILDTDASDYAIGAVLSQEQDGQEKVVAYGSHTLGKSERNYCVTDKELLAVRYFIEYYKQYLLGREFIVRTDHQALVWLFSLKESKRRIARWIEILSQYNFSIQYRPGKKHGNADSLPRMCKNPKQCTCENYEIYNLETLPLKCGACSKCRKKTKEMMSKLLKDQPEQEITECKKSTPGVSTDIIRMITTRSRGNNPAPLSGKINVTEL